MKIIVRKKKLLNDVERKLEFKLRSEQSIGELESTFLQTECAFDFLIRFE